ncbi:hypothetical protein Ocin01_15890 [Orchesella cincta]|uniref:Uncharacterized protein n=1 Tax=Orchesella cincta TaxID=48709 RepID=A0A1D2MD17_ORCCI|nr:hypothetical protein Ocin01_15890 [Orchesella cincta]
MKRLIVTFVFTTTLILIWTSSAKAQFVSTAERQQFATTQTANARTAQGVSPRSSTTLPPPNQTIQCWRCSSPCSRSYCCADTNPQCGILDERRCQCFPRP